MKKLSFLRSIDQLSLALFLYGVVLLLSYTTQGLLFFEWIISFAPYFILFSALIFTLIAILGKKELRRNLFFIISIILIVIGTLIIGKKIINFTAVLPEKGAGSKVITIAFFNKYLYNSNYDAIDQAISSINPDIVGFTEISSADLKGIKKLREYPYSRVKIAEDEFTFGLFSRYPLDSPKAEIKARGIFASKLLFNNDYYNFVLVHPLPPVTSADLWMRNKELEEIQKYLSKLDLQHTILMGDFNTTPWSKTYDIFIGNLRELKNAAKGRGLNFTWGILPMLEAQIDHIFVPGHSVIESFKVEYVKGSDHRLIRVRVKI